MTYKKLSQNRETVGEEVFWAGATSQMQLIIWSSVWVLLQDAVQFGFIFIAAIYNSSHCHCGSSEHPDNNELQECRFWVINDWTSFCMNVSCRYAALSLYICLICTWKDRSWSKMAGQPILMKLETIIFYKQQHCEVYLGFHSLLFQLVFVLIWCIKLCVNYFFLFPGMLDLRN